ncbi:hypothetical protein WA026_013913 [Henosepilachna vigintioctopunctata]|uniref:Uncharacterized protein n=1 Tax=Henosepilachna vigintioctopunctata TaxID=420089 RepID=A0AAW1UB67_9CUCU
MSSTSNNDRIENKTQLEKKPDFISFNKSPCSNFTPPHYSSPMKAEYYNQNKWKANREFNHSINTSGSYSESSYNNSRRRYSPLQRCNKFNNYSGNYSQNYSAQQYSPQGSNHCNNYSGNYSQNYSAQKYSPQGSNHCNKYSGNYSGNFSSNASSTNQYSFPRSGSTKHERDITCYLHPSFMEDPWKRLEDEYLQKNKKQ